MTISQLSLLGLVLVWMPAEAQGIPGTNLSVTVKVVGLTRTGDTTHVSYILTNRPTSKERVLALTIEMPTKPLHASSPSPRQSWGTDLRYGDRPVVRWAALNDSILRPGARSQILSFSALGLPGIAEAHVQGDYDLPEMSEDDPEAEAQTSVDPLVAQSIPLRVVGVHPIPPEATSKSLTARLDSLTRQACTLGWITQARLCSTLRGHLAARPARLVSFRRALAAGHKSGGPVTDNAYWLLKVNADYILSLASKSAPVRQNRITPNAKNPGYHRGVH